MKYSELNETECGNEILSYEFDQFELIRAMLEKIDLDVVALVLTEQETYDEIMDSLQCFAPKQFDEVYGEAFEMYYEKRRVFKSE